MKRRWIVIIFTICFGMGMLLPVHAQEKDKIWAGTNSKIEKIEEALYKDFDDDVKEYQSGHSNDVAEQVAGQCIQCGSFDIRYKTQNSYYARTAACMHGYHAGHDVVKQDILVRYVECQVCRYQEHISNTKIGEPYKMAEPAQSTAESALPEPVLQGRKVNMDDAMWEDAINELDEYIDQQIGEN